MSDKHNAIYRKLVAVAKDPSKKADLHNDPDVCHIVKKLSAADFQVLHSVAAGQTVDPCCHPGPLPSGA